MQDDVAEAVKRKAYGFCKNNVFFQRIPAFLVENRSRL